MITCLIRQGHSGKLCYLTKDSRESLRERERERARSRMVCVNPSPPLLRWPSPWSTPEPGQSEAITPTINSCSASLSMQIEGGRRLGKLFTAAFPPPPHHAVRPSLRAEDLNESCPDHCQSNVILNLTPFPPSFCFAPCTVCSSMRSDLLR